MAAIRTLKNQYLGINAHLHSLLQNEGGWDSFHTSHLVHLTSTLQAQLLPMGNKADLEPSLQIRRHSEKRYHAVWLKPSPAKSDIPLVWLELLTPMNKPNGQDFERYKTKRRKVFEMGIIFVEIDYLHQSPATFDLLNRDTKHECSFRIVVVDPRPNFSEGRVSVYEFGVDEPIPVVKIPLHKADKLSFDFGVPYKKTFEEMFYGNELDYSQLPLKFEAYSEIDRQRIVSRLVAIKRAAQNNASFENDPQSVELMPLEDALQQLNS